VDGPKPRDDVHRRGEVAIVRALPDCVGVSHWFLQITKSSVLVLSADKERF
jgi:hypothetical protein